ncbi:unnamed protein product, partial [Ostreobium quekettii]
ARGSAARTRNGFSPPPAFARETGVWGDANASQSYTTSLPAEGPSRIYTKWVVYKGKGAVSFEPVRPAWKAVGQNGVAIDREGSLLLQFAKCTGPRTYDWSTKKTFALSVAELGDIIIGQEAKFFHDPGMQTSQAGQVTKSLKLSPVENGWFISLTVNEGNDKVTHSVPLTGAEFAILQRIAEYLVPYLLGMEMVFQGPIDVPMDPIPQGERR